MRRAVAGLVVACLAAASSPVRAAEPKQPASATTTPNAALPIHDGVLELSLNDAVRLAIQRSLDVQLLRYDPLESKEVYGAAWGAYDPAIYGTGGHKHLETPTASQILGTLILDEKDWAGE